MNVFTAEHTNCLVSTVTPLSRDADDTVFYIYIKEKSETNVTPVHGEDAFNSLV